jgi:integrase
VVQSPRTDVNIDQQNQTGVNPGDARIHEQPRSQLPANATFRLQRNYSRSVELLSPMVLQTSERRRDERRGSKCQPDWAERDLAIILTALLAGLRAEELRPANVGDLRTTDDGAAVIHVKGKGAG